MNITDDRPSLFFIKISKPIKKPLLHRSTHHSWTRFHDSLDTFQQH